MGEVLIYGATGYTGQLIASHAVERGLRPVLAGRHEDADARGWFRRRAQHCLAAHVAARLPDATRLRMSIGGLTRASRGTAKTMVEAIAEGTRVRSKGRGDVLVTFSELKRGSSSRSRDTRR